MKLLGFVLSVAGWGLVLTAIVLLPSQVSRAAFVFAGIAVEALGLTLVFRAHLTPREDQ